jgi:hypothetical protein
MLFKHLLGFSGATSHIRSTSCLGVPLTCSSPSSKAIRAISQRVSRRKQLGLQRRHERRIHSAALPRSSSRIDRCGDEAAWWQKAGMNPQPVRSGSKRIRSLSAVPMMVDRLPPAAQMRGSRGRARWLYFVSAHQTLRAYFQHDASDVLPVSPPNTRQREPQALRLLTLCRVFQKLPERISRTGVRLGFQERRSGGALSE